MEDEVLNLYYQQEGFSLKYDQMNSMKFRNKYLVICVVGVKKKKENLSEFSRLINTFVLQNFKCIIKLQTKQCICRRVEVKFFFCLCRLEAKDPERVSAGVKPPCGVRSRSSLLRLPLLLPVLQTAAGWTLQTAALQTSECHLV